MDKLRKYVGISLLVVYAFFFASTNFFYHSHQFEGFKVVHSHPFSDKDHNHTAGQILLLDTVSAESFDASDPCALTCFVSREHFCINTEYLSEADASAHGAVNLLRAPPCL